MDPPSGANPKVLLEQLKLLADDPSNYVQDGSQRNELQKLTKLAFRRLEEPFETMQRISYCVTPLIVARISQDHTLFETLAGTKEPIRLDDLSAATKLDSGVLEPIMDVLCSEDIAVEVEQGLYLPTKTTSLMLQPIFRDATVHMHDNVLPGFTALNSVLKNSSNSTTAFQVGQHTNEDFYTWMETHEVQKVAFHRFMEAQFAMLPTWLDAVDFINEFGQQLSQHDAAFVDVGSGAGHQTASLKKKFPNLEGRLIIQDKPDVIAHAVDNEILEKMEYDFFTPQPVKDARVYYFRQIMHNNSDKDCIQILKNHVTAMGSNSVIIIDEKVLPDQKLSATEPGADYLASLSLAMKVMFDAQERREGHWRAMIKQTGLVVKEIRKFTDFNDSVIILAKE